MDGVDIASLARLIAVDVLIIILCGLTVGVPAPRWPARWLDHDRGPLQLRSFETVERYRRFGAQWLIGALPEGGSWTGGQSKASLFGADILSLQRYLVEVRRAEWVHILMSFAWVPLVLFNPWRLWLAFAIGVVAINLPFLIVLRYNRLRLLRILVRASGPVPRTRTASEGSSIRHDDGVIAEPDQL